MSGDTWPKCTAYPDCGHVTTHESPGEANEYARRHKDEFVNTRGYAMCACHPAMVADPFDITRFPCDQSEATP